MLPSKGYFSSVICPFFANDACNRPYCHFKHSKKEKEHFNEEAKSQQLIEELVKKTVEKVLNNSDLKEKPDNGLNTESIVKEVVSTLTNSNSNNSESKTVSYNPTPISELTKRHIPVQYAPAKPSNNYQRIRTSDTYSPTLAKNCFETTKPSTSVYVPEYSSIQNVNYSPSILINNETQSNTETILRSNSPLTYIPTQIDKESKQDIDLEVVSKKDLLDKTKQKSNKEYSEKYKNDKVKSSKSKTIKSEIKVNKKNSDEKAKTDSYKPEHRKSNEHSKKDGNHKHCKNSKSRTKEKHEHFGKKCIKDSRSRKSKNGNLDEPCKKKRRWSVGNCNSGSSSDVELVPIKESCIVISDSSDLSSNDEKTDFSSSPPSKKPKLSISGGTLPVLQNGSTANSILPSSLCERWRKAREQVQRSNNSGKFRICSVPNVVSILHAKDQLLLKASGINTTKQLKIQNIEDVKPQMKQRIAHKSTSEDYPKCILDTNIKIPLSIRQSCLNTMYDTYSLFYPPPDAKEKSIHTELDIAKRVNVTKIYQNSMAICFLRLRNNHGKLDEGQKNESGDVENNLKSDSIPDFTYGRSIYSCMKDYIATKCDLVANGYPLPHPTKIGCAYIDKSARKYSSRKPHNEFERICTNCSTNYFVDENGFPLTQNDCKYHWGKAIKLKEYQYREKYRCCMKDVGSEPCVISRYHVSTTYDDDCLENYVITKGKSEVPQVYALDCEMCNTVIGVELARCTLLSVDGKIIVDSLVLPTTPVLDYCTRFSGITEKKLETCKVTFEEFRKSLLKVIFEDTILIGHGLENDLRALKIIHNTVVDTSIVYPHRLGHPYKNALKYLAKDHLSMNIQENESGHDSKEDAIACLKLMILRIKKDSKERKPRVIISVT